ARARMPGAARCQPQVVHRSPDRCGTERATARKPRCRGLGRATRRSHRPRPRCRRHARLPRRLGCDRRPPVDLSSFIELISWRDAFDVALVALVVYNLLLLIRGTRAVQMLTGILLLVGIYAIARAFD